jgi:hypothetical protein
MLCCLEISSTKLNSPSPLNLASKSQDTWDGEVAQAVEHLPSKHEAQAKKKKKKKFKTLDKM